MVMVSTFTIVLVAMLFATGAADRAARPRVTALVARLQAKDAGVKGDSAEVSAAAATSDSSLPARAWSADTDSLGLVREQVDIAMEELAAARAAYEAEAERAAAREEPGAPAAADSTAARDFARFVKVLESMKPAEAAKLLNGVDDGFTIAVVRRLKERQAAKLLALLEPGKARAVTLALGRAAERDL
jgi:flagellar motility protein MotE (MotC chaperone)